MIREKVESIKLEEKDIKLLKEISQINCNGIDCANCDMCVPANGTVFSCYKYTTRSLLKHIEAEKNETYRGRKE